MIRWLDECPSVRWLGEPGGQLGLFSETTYNDCANNEANKNACYYGCVSAGAGGWNALFLSACQSICITEACGKGILLTPTGMQKVIPKIADCMVLCQTQAEQLTDPVAREAARAACPTTCGLYNEISKLPPEDRPDAKNAPPPNYTPLQTPPSEKSSSQRTTAILVGVLAVAAVAAIVTGAV